MKTFTPYHRDETLESGRRTAMAELMRDEDYPYAKRPERCRFEVERQSRDSILGWVKTTEKERGDLAFPLPDGRA